MSGRRVYLRKDIDEKSIATVIKKLKRFNRENNEPIELIVMSRGGDWYPAKELCDFLLTQIQSSVITIGKKYVCSVAPAILACGSLRLAYAGTEIHFHEVEMDPDAMDYAEDRRWTAEVLSEWADDARSRNEQYLNYCTEKRNTHDRPCALSPNALRKMIRRRRDRECSISSEYAWRLGIIDHVVKTSRGLTRVIRNWRRRHE